NAGNLESLTGSPGPDLAFAFTNGVLSVVSTGVTQPTLNYSVAGNTLTLSWTDAGFKLQSQTNSLTTGLGGNWADVLSGGTSPVSLGLDKANGSVFFRLTQQ
ncbi:MAG TPA: hypothetical protein VLT36_18975, partial [Candidatus Dormibacteraeota bacterium]|nr:hypothetical protein [Candidatus Dormibacteraeota bacterium]